jgi:hypothetical protein
MNLNETLLEAIKSFLDKEEGRYLYEMALKASRLGPCLEIGSYCAKSAIYLGSGCRENNGILFSIDHHRGSEEQQPGEEYFDPDLFDTQSGRVDTFKEFGRMVEEAGLEETVVPIVCRSNVVARLWTGRS